MDGLNELLDRQHRRYRQRMDFLAWKLHWRVNFLFERMLF